MNSWFKQALKARFLSLICLICAGLCPTLPLASQDNLNKQIRFLEEDFTRLSAKFYKDKSSYTSESKRVIKDIDELLSATNRLVENKQSIIAIQLLFFNLDTVLDNLDHRAVFKFTEILLNNNEWKLANRIFTEIKNLGDRSLLATIQFTFAKYHAKRNEWKTVSKLLKGIYPDLSPENSAYAYLLNGSALQRLKKHRPAVESYSKIPVTSKYYAYAQLNTAIANIRQGWWTDAQTTIREMIKISQKDNSDEIINRLYLVLGYALLQREYYRDARNAFRHIGLKSRYTNRALLGIGLTATSQGDYVGGLNALSILKEKKTFDLSVDEAYLLVPYVYEKLQQELTVTTSYTEAMNHYQQRIQALTDISAKHTDFSSVSYDDEASSLIVQNNSLEYGRFFPESFLRNYHMLNQFFAVSKHKKIKKLINMLLQKHDKTFQEIVTILANKRKDHLKSYLNQSRYGLARLFDNRSEEAK